MSYSARHIPIPILLFIWLLFIIFDPGARADWGIFLTITLIYAAWMIVKALIRSRRQKKAGSQLSYQPGFTTTEGYQPGAKPPYEQTRESAAQFYPPLSTEQSPPQDG